MHIDRREFHRTTNGVITISLALMVVAGLENSIAPWAPYYVVYAALATLLPLRWKTYRFGPARNYHWWAWAACPVIAILLQAIATVLVNVVYARIVLAMGGIERLDDPIVAVGAMWNAMFDVAAARLPFSAPTVRVTYMAFIVAWAGLGEELYFRGYVQGTLRKQHSARYAILVASVLFAARHYMQVLLLLPKYPVFAASVWATIALPVGIVLGLLYERTKSLWMPVTIHYLFNVIPFLIR
jgi:membrane protease YdiL (CAAX protease family)